MKAQRAIQQIIRPKSVSEAVLDQLRSDIVTNKFELGQKISEAQLSELYNVTKAPIRAAYIRLEAEGLIEIRAQAGTFVFNLSAEELQALAELRAALELQAISLAMARNLSPLQREVSANYDEMVKCADSGDADGYQKLDTNLHMLFVQHANSPFLAETYASKVSGRFAALRTRFSQQKKHIEHSLAEHKGLRDAIMAGDIDAATKLLSAHIGYSQVYYRGFAKG
ncbi:GntR family transcriptional regulator [Ochrobactrum soli]|uniref:GntR family transcriptional regulator n=1 Tax=Ochrobactrum soli TaxID=2448455 RepID=A0A849KSH6_9HYPH|nr:GntR family transcriptional regulator [[Ochrobactrum] soli]NNU62850.1 GntR family transcriptional regulator [[Ochrobactrum] soli]